MFTIIFFTINENKINLKPKFLEIFYLLLFLPLSNWYLPAKTEQEISAVKLEKKHFQADKYKIIIKACWPESDCFWVHHVLLVLFANHKKISLLGSQRGK